MTDLQLREAFARPASTVMLLPGPTRKALQRIVWRMRAALDTGPTDPALREDHDLLVDLLLPDGAPQKPRGDGDLSCPPCVHCGGVTRPAGACYACTDCGESTGCS